MNTTDRLLQSAKSIWQKYYGHPFVLEIQNGTLEKDKFRFYMIQDYLYLLDYGKVFAIGLTKAKSQEMRSLFTTYLQSLNEYELNIHRGYFAKLHITKEELERSRPSLDNISYTSYMIRTAYEEGEIEALTAVLSCAVSYEYIARNMVNENPDCINHPFYGEWIRGYASEEYHKENQVLIQMLNHLTADDTEEEISHLEEIFVNCSRYELAFWDMSWRLRN